MKIIVPFLGLGLALVLGVALIATQILLENSSERFTNQLIESAKLAAEWNVIEENRLLEGLRLLAYTRGTSQAILDRDTNRLRELSYPLAVNERLEAVEFLDARGSLLLSMHHRPGGLLEEYQFAGEGDSFFSLAPFVSNALGGRSDDRGDKYAGLLMVDEREWLYVAGPVYTEQGKVAGVVLVGSSLDSLTTQLHQQILAQVSFYRVDGTPLASSFPEPHPVTNNLAASILAQEASASYRRGLEDTRNFDILNAGYEELLSPWRAREEIIGLIGVSMFRNVLVNPSLPARVQVVTLVTLVFTLTILFGWFIASTITRPLSRLTRASREVSHGNLTVKVLPPTGNDELSDLASTFNEMVASLHQAQDKLIDAYDSTLLGWSQTLEMREKDTAEHSQRVAEWSVALAKAMGIHGDRLVHIRRGALLHDIGKMPIKDEILLKPGPLDEDEFAVMRKHPVFAWEFLSQIEYLRPALLIPYSHHEKWDGTGYPRGLKGEEIPLEARIFSVIDVWDAVTHERVYHPAGTREEALSIIKEGRGSAFDPQVIDAFLRILPALEAGTYKDNGR